MRNPFYPSRRPVLYPNASLLMIALVIGVLGCDPAQEEIADSVEEPLPTIRATTLTVEQRHWPTTVRCMGSFQADEQSTVGAKVSGRVAEVHIDLGDQVQKGDRLITLDQHQAKLLVVQAEAQLEQARSAIGLVEGKLVEELDPNNAAPVREAQATWDEARTSLLRAKRLLRQNAMSQSEHDQTLAEERVAAAKHQAALNGVREKIALVGVRQAELDFARQQLSDTVVTAPFDGWVQFRGVAPGMYLNVGQVLAVIVRTDPLRFRGSVPERFAMSIRQGQELTLKVESMQQPIAARVSRITPALDQRSRALLFEADVENANGQLQTGLFAEAEIVIDPDALALAVPESAVIEFAGTQKVWKVTEGVSGEQTVLVEPAINGFRKVVEGLQAGQTILLDGNSGRVALVQSLPQEEPPAESTEVIAKTGKDDEPAADSKPVAESKPVADSTLRGAVPQNRNPPPSPPAVVRRTESS